MLAKLPFKNLKILAEFLLKIGLTTLEKQRKILYKSFTLSHTTITNILDIFNHTTETDDATYIHVFYPYALTALKTYIFNMI